jgi:glycosyltransferase involved in cell wall biosynthesis
MATILILGAKVPFTRGGQEVLVGTLKRELEKRGHLVDLIELLYQPLPKEGLLNQAAQWRALDLSSGGAHDVDLVIATKFPTYYARHPRKSLWLVHQHRSIFDLYGTRYSDISDDPRDEALRAALTSGDAQVIKECAYISGISRNVVDRLKLFSNISAEVLYPPLALGNRYRSAPSEDFILSVGRLCSIKRVDLIIKAMPIVHQFVKLKIVGTADEPGIMDYFKNEIDKHHLWDRIEFLGRVDDEELLDLYSRAALVYYAPRDEDYGYVTLEAHASSKPVLSATDSGGVLEFVIHEKNGLVVEPSSDAFGHAVNSLIENKEWAIELGRAGRRAIESCGVLDQGWDRIIEGLLSPLVVQASYGLVSSAAEYSLSRSAEKGS